MAIESRLVQEVVFGFHKFGHEGVKKTMDRIRRDFYWKGWKKMVQDLLGTAKSVNKTSGKYSNQPG